MSELEEALPSQPYEGNRRSMAHGLAALLLWLAVGSLCRGQLIPTKMQPATALAFDKYIGEVEKNLSIRWHGKSGFLSVDDIPGERSLVLNGEFSVRSGGKEELQPVPGGLIHDWVGTVFIPSVKVEQVLKVLQDFDQHSQFYPAIVNSKLKSRDGNHLVGHWRLAQKHQLIPLVLDVDEDEQYEQIAPGRWVCRSHGKNIVEIENADSAREKALPPGEGQGIIWRLNGYWSLETVGTGVLAECRSISLSRSVPLGLTWMVKPILQNFSRDSLTATLKETREAAIRMKSASLANKTAQTERLFAAALPRFASIRQEEVIATPWRAKLGEMKSSSVTCTPGQQSSEER